MPFRWRRDHTICASRRTVPGCHDNSCASDTHCRHSLQLPRPRRRVWRLCPRLAIVNWAVPDRQALASVMRFPFSGDIQSRRGDKWQHAIWDPPQLLGRRFSPQGTPCDVQKMYLNRVRTLSSRGSTNRWATHLQNKLNKALGEAAGKTPSYPHVSALKRAVCEWIISALLLTMSKAPRHGVLSLYDHDFLVPLAT